MITVEVIEDFTLSKFNELKEIKRKNLSTDGRLYKEDTFKCDKEMYDYLTKNNNLGRAFVKAIEIEPKEEITEEVKEKVEEKPKKKKTKKED